MRSSISFNIDLVTRKPDLVANKNWHGQISLHLLVLQ